jgi:hypothetical protein
MSSGTGVDGYRQYLAERNGAPDLLRRRLERREEFFATIDADPVRSRRTIDRDTLPTQPASPAPAEYERPDDVVLDRPVRKHHLAFGRGIHFCVGAPLARLEGQIVLTKLLAGTDHFAFDPDRPPTRVNSLVVRRFGTLPLVAMAAARRP